MSFLDLLKDKFQDSTAPASYYVFYEKGTKNIKAASKWNVHGIGTDEEKILFNIQRKNYDVAQVTEDALKAAVAIIRLNLNLNK